MSTPTIAGFLTLAVGIILLIVYLHNTTQPPPKD